MVWEILEGPDGALLTPDGSLATFQATAPGRYLLGATVDDGGLSGSDTLEIAIIGGLDPPVVAAVNSNGPAVTTSMGIDFAADQHFTGGSTSAATLGILGTRDDALFQTYRWGNFSYSIPVPPGRYFLVLFEAETNAPTRLETVDSTSRSKDSRGSRISMSSSAPAATLP